MVNLYLIRHGRQDSSLCNVDVNLSEEGKIQCQLLRERLKHYQLDQIYSSNLKRAVETAELLNEVLQVPHIRFDELKEIEFGLLEGLTEAQINHQFCDFKEEQNQLLVDLPYPEGENGTSVYERVMPIIQDIVQEDHQNIIIVTHGGVIRAMLSALFGKSQARRFLFGISLENTSITHLIYKPEQDRFYLERFNDFAHLEGQEYLLRNKK